MNNTNISDLLKGCDLVTEDGKPLVQSIGPMQIAFLTAAPKFVDRSFGNPLSSISASNHYYGHLALRNTSSAPVIVPTQVAIFQPGAQNHAMMKAAYIEAMSKVDFTDASCVEGSQPGYLRDGAQTQIRMVPLLMRPYLLAQANDTSSGYSKTYEHIIAMHRLLDVSNGDNYLDRYFSRYGNDLEKFVAHFERPRADVIGFIVLVNGEVVSIDKFPNFEYPGYLWELIVRDCYASIAVALGKSGATHPRIVVDDVAMVNADDPVAYLESAVYSTLDGIADRVRDAIRDLIGVAFTEKPDSAGGLSSKILDSDAFSGQVIRRTIDDEDVNVYVSIVRKNLMEPRVLSDLGKAANVRRISSKQKKFSV